MSAVHKGTCVGVVTDTENIIKKYFKTDDCNTLLIEFQTRESQQ